jgi:hypothetical protein
MNLLSEQKMPARQVTHDGDTSPDAPDPNQPDHTFVVFAIVVAMVLAGYVNIGTSHIVAAVLCFIIAFIVDCLWLGDRIKGR